jgi:hypothetical protein
VCRFESLVNEVVQELELSDAADGSEMEGAEMVIYTTHGASSVQQRLSPWSPFDSDKATMADFGSTKIIYKPPKQSILHTYSAIGGFQHSRGSRRSRDMAFARWVLSLPPLLSKVSLVDPSPRHAWSTNLHVCRLRCPVGARSGPRIIAILRAHSHGGRPMIVLTLVRLDNSCFEGAAVIQMGPG